MLAPAEEADNVEVSVVRLAQTGLAEPPRQRAEHALRRQPEHQEQKGAEDEQAVLGEARDQLRQHDSDDRTDHGAQRPAGAADDHGQQE